MSSTDTPLNTVEMLRRKQQQTKSPYINLTGGSMLSAGSKISKWAAFFCDQLPILPGVLFTFQKQNAYSVFKLSQYFLFESDLQSCLYFRILTCIHLGSCVDLTFMCHSSEMSRRNSNRTWTDSQSLSKLSNVSGVFNLKGKHKQNGGKV